MSDWITQKPELSEEDLERVRRVTQRGYNETERKGFNPWWTFLLLWVVLIGFGLLSYWIADLSGAL